jgi:hypothetical protein
MLKDAYDANVEAVDLPEEQLRQRVLGRIKSKN